MARTRSTRGAVWIGALLPMLAREAEAQAHMLRGDANHDMEIDISDGIATLGYLFVGSAAPPCLDAADVDDSGEIDIGDAVFTFNFLFGGGPPPAAPYLTFELDPTEDVLGCLGPPIRIEGNITTDQSWTRDRVYALVSEVHVKAPAVLTIEAGTTVLGDSITDGALVIERGAKIIAVGTETHPVVFTTDRPAGERSRNAWKGLVLLGRAQVNIPGGLGLQEGSIQPIHYGGGANPDNSDSSGDLRYVRIEWCGKGFALTSQSAGLSLLAVGSQTRLDHIMVRYGSGDGIDFVGGAASLAYAVVDACEIDMFDASFGWSGGGQFWLGRSKADFARHGFEVDNSDVPPGTQGFMDTPITRPSITNVTLIGANDQATPNGQVGLLLRRGAGSHLHNFIVEGFKVAGVDVDDPVTCAQNFPDHLFIKHSLFHGNGASGTQHSMAQPETATGQDETAWAAPCTNASERLVNDPTNILATAPPTVDPYQRTAPDFRPQGPDPTTNPFDPTSIGTFFETAPYRGALSPDPSADWTRKPWISWTEK